MLLLSADSFNVLIKVKDWVDDAKKFQETSGEAEKRRSGEAEKRGVKYGPFVELLFIVFSC